MNRLFGNDTRVLFFDLDGCIYFGRTLADRANDLLRLLRESGLRFGFITNNSRESAAEIRGKLTDMGLELGEELIVSATEAIAVYLAERYGSVSVKVAGSESLSFALAEHDHRVLAWEEATLADTVVIGRDTEFDYERLQQIVNEVLKGARIVSTNPDTSHPGEGGKLIPETGALLAAVEAVVGTAAVEIICIGKPHGWLYELAMKWSGVSPAECIMVGDNLITDIAGADKAGIKSVWIRHSDYAMPVSPPIVPTITVNKLSELYDLIVAEQCLKRG